MRVRHADQTLPAAAASRNATLTRSGHTTRPEQSYGLPHRTCEETTRTYCATPPGFEPRTPDPESGVLPLHHGALLTRPVRARAAEGAGIEPARALRPGPFSRRPACIQLGIPSTDDSGHLRVRTAETGRVELPRVPEPLTDFKSAAAATSADVSSAEGWGFEPQEAADHRPYTISNGAPRPPVAFLAQHSLWRREGDSNPRRLP